MGDNRRIETLSLEKDALLETIAAVIAKSAFAGRLVLKRCREAEESAKWDFEDTA